MSRTGYTHPLVVFEHLDNGDVMWSKNRIAVLLSVCLTCLVQTLVYAIPLPVLPNYLLSHETLNLTQGHFGVIMAISTAVTVIIQPIVGRLLVSTISDKVMMSAGLLINGVITAAMLLLAECQTRTQLYYTTLTLHALASCGHSMSSVAVYVAVGAHLSDVNHIMLPAFDILFGIALLIGPLIGWPLYVHGGVKIVYIVTGGICMASALLVALFYPRKRAEGGEEADDESSPKPTKSKASYSILLKWPLILNILIIAHCYCMMTLNDVSLTFRLHSVIENWPGENSVLIFGVAGATFALLGIGFGYLSKAIADTRLYVLLALPIGAGAWILLSSIFNWCKNLFWMYLAQLLLGLSMSPMYICSYFFSLKALNGENDPGVYAVVSGVFNPTANLGGALGQFLSKYLEIPKEHPYVQRIGPDSAMIALNMILFVVLGVTMCFSRASIKTRS